MGSGLQRVITMTTNRSNVKTSSAEIFVSRDASMDKPPKQNGSRGGDGMAPNQLGPGLSEVTPKQKDISLFKGEIT